MGTKLAGPSSRNRRSGGTTEVANFAVSDQDLINP
jgi:hypothetical protein